MAFVGVGYPDIFGEEDPALLIFLEYMPSGSIKAVSQSVCGEVRGEMGWDDHHFWPIFCK